MLLDAPYMKNPYPIKEAVDRKRRILAKKNAIATNMKKYLFNFQSKFFIFNLLICLRNRGNEEGSTEASPKLLR